MAAAGGVGDTSDAAAAVSAAQGSMALSAAAAKVVDAAKRKFATGMDQEVGRAWTMRVHGGRRRQLDRQHSSCASTNWNLAV
jgi:hypothetical protein